MGKKKPVGRPTLYNDAILAKAKYYLDNYKSHGHVVPQIAGLARVLGVRRETLYAWAKEENKEEFSNILEEIMSEQEISLINGGLGGDFNSNITKMMLTKHGYSDKQEVNHQNDGGKFDVIERVIVQAKKEG